MALYVSESVPMRWPAGPLDIARGEKTKGFSAETAEVLRNWQDPASLEVVQGTPVNRLVISWASGLAADAGQQQALKPLIEKGRQAGLGFVGLIEAGADKPAAVAAAQSAGLSAVAVEGDAPGSAGVPVIPWNKSSRAPGKTNSPVVGISDGIFPGLPQAAAPAGGPTNLPWVDSNGAVLLIARALAPEKTVWIGFDPPPQAKLAAEAYMLAVADSASYGARWVISLDDQMRADLTAKKQPAADTWKRLIDTLAFFEQHNQARTYQPAGNLAVVSDFAGPNWDVGEEALNLMPRIRQPFRVIARSRAADASFTGLQGVFYVDREPPAPELRKKLMAFASGGGILFVPSKWPNPEGSPAPAEPYLLFSMRAVGKGRLAVCKEDKPDPYDLVADIQNILSHRNDLLRLYNAPSANFLYETSAQGRQGVIHVLNYSRRPGSDGPLFYVKEPHKSARLVSPEIASPTELQWAPQEAGGAELSLPRFSVYGAIELEKQEAKETAMKQDLTRRELLAGAGVGALLARPAWSRAAAAPTGRVTVARCKTYGTELAPTMEKTFDQLGGLGGLVKGKTVAIKVNFIGVRWSRLGNALMEDTFWTHPRIIGATASLLGKAGARRIRVLEGPWSTSETLEEVMLSMNWKPQDILNAASNVEFENTNYLGRGKKYSRFLVPGGGLIYPGYDLNHSYEDCDVFVSLAKMKEHSATGVTLSMKNVYGATPITIYGQDAGVDEPSIRPHGGRGNVFHFATRLPSKSAPQQKDMSLPKDAGFRLPRIVAELNSARPVHLAIIDGIKTATGGETAGGLKAAVNPGVIIAGTNTVATDAVAMAVMGFDPLAERGKPPFARCDSTLRFGEELGVGIRDLSRNEVVGVPIKEVVFDYNAVREKLQAAQKKG